jgi:hypothetical protein
MGLAFARARRDAYLLLRMEAQEFDQRIVLEDPGCGQDDGQEPEFAHQHSEACACHLRGE